MRRVRHPEKCSSKSILRGSFRPLRILGFASAVVVVVLFPPVLYVASELYADDTSSTWSPRVARTLDDLPYDDNSHLASHLFVYPNGPCAELVESQIQQKEAGNIRHLPIAVEGDAAEAFFGKQHSLPHPPVGVGDCPAACVQRGVDATLVSALMPDRFWDREVDIPDFLLSMSCGEVEVGFVNYHVRPVDLYWLNGEDWVLVQHNLQQSDKYTKYVTTFVGHRFIADDPETDQVLLDHVVQFTGVIGIKNHVTIHNKKENISTEVRNTMQGEWRKHSMVKRTFSALGFSKGRLPDDLFASMSAFRYNNRDPPHRLMEELDGRGLYVNYWETDCNFIQVPWELKRIWQKRLKVMVEAWTGIELETTHMYGMRQYEVGARLLTHVDNINTHAASLIINIAQGNLTQPWTVEVYDHADRLHELVMHPGDILYYESAKCLHGRNTPLAGGFYTNLFTHYRPVDDPMWYKKRNPEGSPEPLIDVGDCHLVGKKDEYSQGAVKCDNDAIGTNLSPKMIQARGGDDLYQMWRSASPSGYFGEESSTDHSDEL